MGVAAQKMALREYIDSLRDQGYTVQGSTEEDPTLLAPTAGAVETWREDYPYDELIDTEVYEERSTNSRSSSSFQYWSRDEGHKHVLVSRARDAAGKGGTIKRFMEHLNPRAARVVALNSRAPTRPGSGTSSATSATCRPPVKSSLRPQLVQPRGRRAGHGLLHRGPVPGLHEAGPAFERMLVESGTTVTKLWFSVTQQEQRTCFAIRQLDPVRQWKLSPMDLESLDRWRPPHRRQGGDVRAHRQEDRAVDHGEVQ